MEKRIFYLSDPGTNKIIPIEAVREKHQGQWTALCAKCKASNRTVTINDKLNIFHCHKCEWQGDLNHLNRSKQPPTNTDNGKLFKEHWKSYLDLGFLPFPASKKYKGPVVPWKDENTGEPIQPTFEDYRKWENEYADNNIWVLIGPHRVILDPDGPLAEKFVQSLSLLDGPTSKSGGKSRHRFFMTKEPIEFLKVKFGEGDFLEVRTGSLGMLVPPSIHPVTGRTYQWEERHSPWEIPSPEFSKEAYQKIKELMPAPKMSKPCGENQESVFGRFDVDRYLTEHGIDYRVRQRGDKIFYLLRQCLFTSEHGHGDIPGDAAIVQDLSGGKLGYHCFHNSCFDKTWGEARKAISGDKKIFQFCQGYTEHQSQQTDPKTPPKVDEVKKAHHFNLKTAREIAEMQEPERKWLLYGFIPWAGSALILSKPKVGKTTLEINLSISAARGEDFLGRKMEKCTVVYLGLEMKDSHIKPILRELGATKEENLICHCGRAPAQAVSEIRPLLQETKAGLLIIDMIQKLARTKDINAYAELSNSLEQIIGIAQEEDCATVISHHMGKSDREDADDAIGSTAFAGGVDTIICIKTLDPEKPLKSRRRYMYTIQRYGDDLEKSILKKLPSGSLELEGPLTEVELSETMTEILAAMHLDTKYKQDEIRTLVPRQRVLVCSALTELHNQGHIKREGKGVRKAPFLYEKVAK